MKKKLELTEQELNVVLFALQKQPFEVVNELLRNIITQVNPSAMVQPLVEEVVE